MKRPLLTGVCLAAKQIQAMPNPTIPYALPIQLARLAREGQSKSGIASFVIALLPFLVGIVVLSLEVWFQWTNPVYGTPPPEYRWLGQLSYLLMICVVFWYPLILISIGFGVAGLVQRYRSRRIAIIAISLDIASIGIWAAITWLIK